MRAMSSLTKEDVKELIKRFFARNKPLILAVFIMLSLILLGMMLNYAITLSTPAAVTLEYKKSGDDVFKGYSIYLDDDQPTMGILKDGEICKTIPIEREEYNTIMAIDYKNGLRTQVDLCGALGNAPVKVTVKDHMGRETVTDDYILSLELKLSDLIKKYGKN